jgi:6,7-dimethyl-8-ribityllumazine synthase
MTPAEGIDASGLRIAVVAARFNGTITEKLVDGARACLIDHGAQDEPAVWVPGAFELPLASAGLAHDHDAVVALGCVIRGETPHFDFVAAECARGLMTVMLQTAVPVAFGVLTTEDEAQARARAGGAVGNKGYDATLTAIEMALLMRGWHKHEA